MQILLEDPAKAPQAAALASQLGQTDLPQFALVFTAARLELRKLDEPKLGAVYVDFVEGAVAHRRKFGGGVASPSPRRWGSRRVPCRGWWMPPPGWGAMPSCSPPRL